MVTSGRHIFQGIKAPTIAGDYTAVFGVVSSVTAKTFTLCSSPIQLKAEEGKIKSSLYSRYYAESCNEWWDPSPRFSAWTTQLRRNIAAMVSRLRHFVRFDQLGNRTQTFRVDTDVFNHCSHSPVSEKRFILKYSSF